MQVSNNPASLIFTGANVLEIPFFQRAYVWGHNEWERLLDDMKHISQNKKPYFFGSIILKQQDAPLIPGIAASDLLIDGQQRLTTLIIFFKTVALKNPQYDWLFKKFLLISPPNRLALWHNHNNLESFEKVCNFNELTDIPEDDRGKDNILDAYQFFNENIDTEKLENDLDVNAINNNLMVVSIRLFGEEDEQQIFDTINSLGVRLTTAELLKNYFFSRDEIDVYERNWKAVFEKDDETKNYWDREITVGRLRRTLIDLFFYAYLQIKVQEPALRVSSKDKENFLRVEDLFRSYKTLIENYSLDKNEIIGEIKDYAEIFRKNFDHEIVHRGLTSNSGIERIVAIIFGLDTSTLIPYTLFILKNVQSDDERSDLFGSIESYIMRRMAVKANIKNYNLLFTIKMIGNRVLSKAEFQNQIQKRGEQVNAMPSDAELEKGFAESKLINKQAAGILYFIETVIGESSKNAIRLWGISGYSLEHIMPKKWRKKEWPLSATQDENERNRVLLTLGNLAIIRPSLNASLKNKDWETKKKGRGEGKEGLEYHASGLATLHKFLKAPDWNEREIEKRAEYLCEKAIEVWPFK